MKLASWVCCAISFAALAGCGRDKTVELTEADFIVADAGDKPLMVAQLQLPPAEAVAQRIALPYVSDLRRIDPADRGVLKRTWLLMHFDDPRSSDDDALMLYLARWGSVEHQWILNGSPIVSAPNTTTTGWNTPELLLLPEGHLRAKGNELALICDSPGASYMITRPRLGAQSDIEWRYRLRVLVQLDAVRGISVLFALLGTFALLFWLRRRREHSYLLFAATALAWIIRLLQYHSDVDSTWAAWRAVNSLLWAIVCTYLFALSLSGSRSKVPASVMAASALAIAVVTLPGAGFIADVWQVAPWINLLASLLSIVLAIQLTAIGYRERKRSRYALVFAVMLWMSLGFGVHDLMMQANIIGQESIYLLPYGAFAQVMTFAFGVYQRLTDSVGEVDQLNQELGERVQATEERLKAAYQELSQFERQRAVDEERQRLMREMHDGLGSSLMTSLAMAERGNVDQMVMTEALRESLQQLQLTVDSLEPMGGDLATVLGTLRYRLGARLEAAGLKVHWQAAALPTLSWLDAHAALHVLRIVQEVLTNILKHAHASDITLATEVGDNCVFVRVIDNGRGFDVEAHRKRKVSGHGLGNIERRAQQLHGRTTITSGPNGTTFELVLPIEKGG